MNTDKPYLGILCMLAFCAMAPLGDAMAKILGGVISVGAMVTIRFAAQALVLGPMTLLFGPLRKPTGRILMMIWIRTLFHILGIGLMFSALKFLPLADAIAIAFVMPFLMLLAGFVFLGEEVGPHRLAACGVGFVGMLLVVQPNFSQFGWPALLPIGVAVTFVGFMLATRAIAKDIHPIPLQAISGAMASVTLIPICLAFPSGALTSFAGLGSASLSVILALALIGTVAHLFMTWSLKFAPSATLAPIQYMEIPFATAIGWVIFRDFPNGIAAVGICLTIAAGIYIILRERAIAQRAAAPAIL